MRASAIPVLAAVGAGVLRVGRKLVDRRHSRIADSRHGVKHRSARLCPPYHDAMQLAAVRTPVQPPVDPTEALREARRRRSTHKPGGRPGIPPDIAHSVWKTITENLDAAIFAHGTRQFFLERDVCFAPFEAQDHDFALRFGPAEKPIYCPVQLRVFVSTDVNPMLTPESLPNRLRKYSDAANLVAAVKIDRRGADPRGFKVPPLQVGELWFFGPRPGVTDGRYLSGDRLGTQQWVEFELFDGRSGAC
jgi:hypothetical protein